MEKELEIKIMRILVRLWSGFAVLAFGVFGIIMTFHIARPGFQAPDSMITLSLWAFVVGLTLYVIGASVMVHALKELSAILFKK